MRLRFGFFFGGCADADGFRCVGFAVRGIGADFFAFDMELRFACL